MRLGLVLVSLLLLAGCSSKKFCERQQPYQEAREYPALKAPAGLAVPETDPSLQIPPVAPSAPATTSEGECLDTPPRLPVNVVTPVKPVQKP